MFINYPIYLWQSKSVSREVPDDEEADEDLDDEEREEREATRQEAAEDGDEEAEKKMKTIREEVWDWELVNENKAIWLRPKEEIDRTDYIEFYKAMTGEY